MALSSEVQKLIDAKKWQEAYDLASTGKTSAVDDSFLVQVEDSVSGKDGYVKGDATSYSLVTNAEDASSLSKKDAGKLAKTIKSKQISTMLVKRSDVIQDAGSQGTEKGEVIDLFLKNRFSKVDFNSIKDITTK